MGLGNEFKARTPLVLLGLKSEASFLMKEAASVVMLRQETANAYLLEDRARSRRTKL